MMPNNYSQSPTVFDLESIGSNHSIWCLILSICMFTVLKLNEKLYFHKKTKRHNKYFKFNNYSIASSFRKLILISFCKIVLAGIIYIALKNPEAQPKPIRFDNKIWNKGYFLSIEYYEDIYLIKEQDFNHILKWHCLSKLKLKSFDKFYQTLLRLSGDIALNPGPVPYPCSKCQVNVGRDSILCTQCNMWIHRLCEGGLSKADLTSLSKSTDQMSKFVCTVCRGLDISRH